MKTLLIPLILSIAIVQCESQKTDPGKSLSSDNDLTTKLDSIGNDFIDQGQVMGISVAIMQGQDTLYNNGFGVTYLEGTKPVTNQTKFKIASISKLIGSTLVMKLAEEGKLSLDQTLHELLPDFPNREQAQKITLRHMLSHTSGLQDYASVIDSVYLETGVDPTKEDYYHFFKEHPLHFEPGSNYSYSNSGFVLMAMIVERITGRSFQQEIDRVINSPAGLNLKLVKEAVDDPKMSDYVELKDSVFHPFPIWPWIKGDGGLTTTSIELAQFPRQWSSGKIISEASFLEMTEPMILSDGVQTGYGIGVRNGEFYGEKIIGHTGGHKSVYAIMVYFPERDLTFVAFTNTDNTPTSVRQVFAEFARTILGKDKPDFKKEEVDNDHLSIYPGTYGAHDEKIKEAITIELNPDENRLYYCLSEECEPMYYLGNHKFWMERWPYDHVVFHVTKTGETLVIKEYFTGYYAVLRKKIK